MPFSDNANKINQSLVSFPLICGKARYLITQIKITKCRIRIDFARHKSLTKRPIDHQTDAQTLK